VRLLHFFYSEGELLVSTFELFAYEFEFVEFEIQHYFSASWLVVLRNVIDQPVDLLQKIIDAFVEGQLPKGPGNMLLRGLARIQQVLLTVGTDRLLMLLRFEECGNLLLQISSLLLLH